MAGYPDSANPPHWGVPRFCLSSNRGHPDSANLQREGVPRFHQWKLKSLQPPTPVFWKWSLILNIGDTEAIFMFFFIRPYTNIGYIWYFTDLCYIENVVFNIYFVIASYMLHMLFYG